MIFVKIWSVTVQAYIRKKLQQSTRHKFNCCLHITWIVIYGKYTRCLRLIERNNFKLNKVTKLVYQKIIKGVRSNLIKIKPQHGMKTKIKSRKRRSRRRKRSNNNIFFCSVKHISSCLMQLCVMIGRLVTQYFHQQSIY